MKKLLIILTFIAGLCILLPSGIYAQFTERSLYITCSVIANAYVDVTNYTAVSNWNILNKNFSFSTNRDAPAAGVSNAGTANETFRLQVEHFGVVGSTGWTNSTTTNNGPNIFVLQAIFGPGTQPGVNNYLANDVVIATPTSASSSNFAIDGSSTNGYNVPNGEVRNLWMRFKFPSSGVANPVQPTCRLIISAVVQ